MKRIAIFLCALTLVQAKQDEVKTFIPNTVSVNPSFLFSGGVLGSFEHDFSKDNGIILEAGMIFPKVTRSYFGEIAFKHYFKEKPMVFSRKSKSGKEYGTKISYWGPSFRAKSIRAVVLDEKDIEHRFWVQYVYPGINFGQKRIFTNHITLTSKIGYGLPIEIGAWQWDSEPKSESLYRNMFKYTSGLNAGLSVGFSF